MHYQTKEQNHLVSYTNIIAVETESNLQTSYIVHQAKIIRSHCNRWFYRCTFTKIEFRDETTNQLHAVGFVEFLGASTQLNGKNRITTRSHTN